MLVRHLFEFSVIETPEFQRWFAGSKIVDAAGNPLKLYHGTSKDQDFRKFRVPGNGAWFTTSSKDASDYADQNDTQGHRWENGHFVKTNTASRVMPVYVRAINPARVDQLPREVQMAGSNGGDPTRAYRRAQREWFDRLRMEGHDAVIIGDHTVVVLKDASQIKSAIGNKNFNPTKPNMNEATA